MGKKYEDLTEEEKVKLLNEQQETIDRMSRSQTQYNDNLKEANFTWGSIKKKIEESNNVAVVWGNMIRNASLQMAAFVTDTKSQYNLSEKIAEEYKKVSFEMGLTAKGGKALAESFKAAVPFVQRLGMDAASLGEIYTKISEDSGRMKLFNQKDLETMALMSKSFKLGEDATGEMVDRFDLMGISVKTMGKTFSDTFEDASKMGLNSQKVIEVLSNNFASMQRMSFAGGTKAMTQMAKLAVDMRMDVSSMLGMAEKFYNPEQAIEAAAELQLMGGDIAAAFGDPFEVMYLARNKPEELAKKVQSMTENMVQFNEQTGEYELPPEALQQLTFMSDKLGQNKDQIIDMAFQSSKLKDVRDAMSDSTMFSEDEQSAIAQMAKFNKDTGQFEVTVGEETFRLNDQGLKDAMKDGLLEREKTGEEGQMALVDNSFTTNKLLQNMLAEFKAGISVKSDFYEIGENILNETINTMSDGNTRLIKQFGDVIGDAKDGNSTNKLLNELLDPSKQKSLGGMISKQVDAVYKLTEQLIAGGSVDNTKNLEDGVINATTALNEFNESVNKLMGSKVGNSIGGNVSGNANNVTNDIKIGDGLIAPDGGLVVSGEKGQYNLDNMDSVLAGTDLFGGNDSSNVSGELTIPDFNINVNLNGANGLSADDLGKTLMPVLKAKILEKMGDQIFVKGGKEKDGFPTNATS